jgi:hypothetical protein
VARGGCHILGCIKVNCLDFAKPFVAQYFGDFADFSTLAPVPTGSALALTVAT